MNTVPATDFDCCHVAAPATATQAQLADLLQARAIARHLSRHVDGRRIAAAWDADADAAVVRVDSTRGLWSLVIPPVGRAFPVLQGGRRIGALDVRRVPATTDSGTADHLTAYLRDRAAL